MGAVADFADFGPISESEVGARNGQERVECGPERPIRAAGEVRRRSQEPAPVRGNRRDQTRKNPNRERLGFHYWWSRGELNPRPQVLRYKIYMLIRSIDLAPGYPIGRENLMPALSFLALHYPRHACIAIL